jgi:hypothetical protein
MKVIASEFGFEVKDGFWSKLRFFKEIIEVDLRLRRGWNFVFIGIGLESERVV